LVPKLVAPVKGYSVIRNQRVANGFAIRGARESDDSVNN
jgi:hypothetical protein